jgi:hypothetical protein
MVTQLVAQVRFRWTLTEAVYENIQCHHIMG